MCWLLTNNLSLIWMLVPIQILTQRCGCRPDFDWPRWLVAGERRLPSDHEWANVEEVPLQLLRVCPGAGSAVPVQHHLRPVHDGQRHLPAHGLDRLAGSSLQTHQHIGRYSTRRGCRVCAVFGEQLRCSFPLQGLGKFGKNSIFGRGLG